MFGLALWLAGSQLVLAQENSATPPPETDAPMGGTDAEARAVFMAAEVAFNEGRFESAVQYFLQSFRLSGRPELLYNIGNTYDRLQKPEEALEYFDLYLRQRPNAENNKQVEARTRLLRRAVDERAMFPNSAAPPVPTPEETAQAQVAAFEAPAPVSAPPAAIAPTSEGDSSWLLWTGVGASAVIVTVVAIVIATSANTTQGPLLPSDDVAVRRL
jgi:tetratricopeptide (TPR) repeat protein